MSSFNDNDFARASEKMKKELEEHLRTLMGDLPTRQRAAGTSTNINNANTSTEEDNAPRTIPLAAQQPFSDFKPKRFAKPFCKFLSNNPTVFHASSALAAQCEDAGFTRLSERAGWKLEKGGKYFVERNGSSLIAFAVGEAYEPGNGVAMIAGHIDALTARIKPIPTKKTTEGFLQLGIAPYSGGLNTTWWDRDLAIAGRVLVKGEDGKITQKLINIDEPIAKVPTLAPHFGAPAQGPFNNETQMVPIVGLDNSDLDGGESQKKTSVGPVGSFAATQPPRLVRAVAQQLGLQGQLGDIISWELELYDLQPATLSGFDKEFISGGRIDDKLCSWSALQALLGSTYTGPSSDDDDSSAPSKSSIIKLVALFDDEEIGSLLRQGAQGNFLPSVIERTVDSFSKASPGANLINQTYANSYLISADVSHAVNPNFLNVYLEHHMPRLNVGPAVSCDPNGHMTTDAVSSALISRIAEKSGSKLQVFQIRNDSRSGGTVGPMLSSHMGCRAIDIGQVQLSMHSIRATTGALDPGLGVKLWKGFFDFYEEIDKEFQ